MTPERLREKVAEATPGPWRLKDGYDVVSDALPEDDAWILWDRADTPGGDAALIALAPELAEVAADMAEALEEIRDARIHRGSSSGPTPKPEDFVPTYGELAADRARAALARFAQLGEK